MKLEIDLISLIANNAQNNACLFVRCEIGPETPKQEIAELTSEDYGVNTFRLSMCGGSNEKRFKSDGDRTNVLCDWTSFRSCFM